MQEMVVLLVLPIVIELVTRGIACRCAIEGGTHVLWCILADGEMSALAWLPSIIAMMLLGVTKPARILPEPGKYIRKGQRHNMEESGGWFWKNIPTWVSKSEPNRLATIGAPKVSFTYSKFSRRERRESGRRANRRMAMSMRLVTI